MISFNIIASTVRTVPVLLVVLIKINIKNRKCLSPVKQEVSIVIIWFKSLFPNVTCGPTLGLDLKQRHRATERERQMSSLDVSFFYISCLIY